MLQMNRKKKGDVVIGIITLIGLTLLLLPASYFDEGQSMCISVLIFDKQCYACGMTRAVQHLIHFDFDAAAHYIKLAFIVVPLGVYMDANDIYKKFFKYQNN